MNVATGDTWSCPRLDKIFLITNYHVPADPRFENMFRYSNLADFNYAPIDIAFDEGTVTNTTTFRPSDYQNGIRGTHGQAVTPQPTQTMGVAEEQPSVVRNDLSLVVKANPSSLGSAQTIVFTLPQSERATLRVYDVSGRIVTTLLIVSSRRASIPSPGKVSMTPAELLPPASTSWSSRRQGASQGKARRVPMSSR